MKERKSITFILILVFAVSILAIVIPKLARVKDEDKAGKDFAEASTEETTEETTEEIRMIKVYVSGEVNNPGVYEVREDMRVEDVIKIAGDASENADIEKINLAEYVYDAQQIDVPSKNDENYSSADSSAGGKININTADIYQLESLSGIGESRAQDIIKYREKNGRFKKIEDIMNISGIGQKIFDGFKDKITV